MVDHRTAAACDVSAWGQYIKAICPDSHYSVKLKSIHRAQQTVTSHPCKMTPNVRGHIVSDFEGPWKELRAMIKAQKKS